MEKINLDLMIFSKDRAMQLDLLLRSIKDNFKEIDLENVPILVKASTKEFDEGYDKLIRKFPECKFITEQNFVDDIRNIFNNFTKDFCFTLVDDEIVINDYSIKEGIELLQKNETLHCISLRMHPKVTYCYTANLPSPFPEHEKVGNLYKWQWNKADPRTDSGYPSCINSHIYHTQIMKFWVNQIQFNNANSLEGIFNMNRARFQPHMACFELPKTVNIANNLTQSGVNRYSKNPAFDLEHMNDKYLLDFIIDEKPFYGMLENTPTFEKDYIFR